MPLEGYSRRCWWCGRGIPDICAWWEHPKHKSPICNPCWVEGGNDQTGSSFRGERA